MNHALASAQASSLTGRRAGPLLRVAMVVAIALAPTLARAQTTTTAAGANAAAIQSAVDAYRASLGTLNANVAGSFGSGRREINWDGVPDALAAPNNMPATFFNSNSPRGVVFTTPGTGFQVSANAVPGPTLFSNINATYATTFSTFSAQRLFTAIGSNVLDVNFFVPGSSVAALTNGFGAIFTDVDLANTTSLQFFDAANISLGTFFAPALAGASGSLSFLGVAFSSAVVSRVRITAGNAALGPNDQNGSPTDVVAMDDFIYGEPIAAAVVPEPASVLLVASGLLAVGLVSRRRRGR